MVQSVTQEYNVAWYNICLSTKIIMNEIQVDKNNKIADL